jgi:hypothetical protein
MVMVIDEGDDDAGNGGDYDDDYHNDYDYDDDGVWWL